MQVNLSQKDAFNVIDAWRNSADAEHGNPISENLSKIQNRIMDIAIDNYQKGDFEAVPVIDVSEYDEKDQMEFAGLLSSWCFVMRNKDHTVITTVFQSIHNHGGKLAFVLSPVLEEALKILADEGQNKND